MKWVANAFESRLQIVFEDFGVSLADSEAEGRLAAQTLVLAEPFTPGDRRRVLGFYADYELGWQRKRPTRHEIYVSLQDASKVVSIPWAYVQPGGDPAGGSEIRLERLFSIPELASAHDGVVGSAQAVHPDAVLSISVVVQREAEEFDVSVQIVSVDLLPVFGE